MEKFPLNTVDESRWRVKHYRRVKCAAIVKGKACGKYPDEHGVEARRGSKVSHPFVMPENTREDKKKRESE